MNSNKLLAIISDIHGNEEALNAVLAVAKERGADEFICLGDVVGYGASVKECIATVRSVCSFVVQGNHDGEIMPPRNVYMRAEAIAALEYASGVLSQEDIDWLLSRKQPIIGGERKFVALHGSLEGRDDYILSHKDVSRNLGLFDKLFPDINVAFFGHTHLPMVLARNGACTSIAEDMTFKLESEVKYLINPGSVGQPRDGVNKASFALFDIEENEISINRVEYDIEKEQGKMRAVGLPDRNILRIAQGR